MADNSCAKCRKNLASTRKSFRCTRCKAYFCPSCMDRFCLFCRAPVEKTLSGESPAATAGAPAPRRFQKTLLILLGCAIALLLLEAACRWMFKKNVQSLSFSASDLYYYTDLKGQRHNLPGRTGYERMWNDQGKAEFRIDSLGFRGKEFPAIKPAGMHRILFLGDSITLGGRLPQDVIFVDKVAQALSASHETANAGVGDIGLVEEEEILKTSGVKFKPDLVVLCWFLNDARPAVGFPEEVVYKHPLIQAVDRSAWLRKSYLMGFLYARLRQSLVDRQIKLMDQQSSRFQWAPAYMAGHWRSDPAEFERLVDLARFDWGDAWNKDSLREMFDKINALRKFSTEHGARFAVVALPVHAQLYSNSPIADRPQREMRKLCESAGIPFLDILPALKARKAEPLFYDHCHYTPFGNSVVSDAILSFLKRSSLL
ncbi:MAG: hypothetical protein WCU88_11070 [Elusimicrobiota bacterium]|jgi:hypothetical protein